MIRPKVFYFISGVFDLNLYLNREQNVAHPGGVEDEVKGPKGPSLDASARSQDLDFFCVGHFYLDVTSGDQKPLFTQNKLNRISASSCFCSFLTKSWVSNLFCTGVLLICQII